MKNYIEFCQPSTGKILMNNMINFLSSLQTACNKKCALSKSKGITLVSLSLVSCALLFGCSLFSVIIVAFFLLTCGMLIHELRQYIRSICKEE